jgi:hypothetical protein
VTLRWPVDAFSRPPSTPAPPIVLAAKPRVKGLRGLGRGEMKHREVAIVVGGGKQVGRRAERLCDAERRFAVRRAAHCFVRQLDAVRPRRRIWARPISPLRTMVRPRFTAAGTAAADWRSSPAAARALLHRRAYRASCRRSRSKLLVGVEPLQYFVNLADDLSPDVGGSGRASCAVCFSAFCLCRSNSAGASSVPTWLC